MPQIYQWIVSIKPEIWALLIALLAILVPFVENRWQAWKQRSKQRLLEKDFGSHLYHPSVLDQSTRYYVEPHCSNIDPSREAELRNVILAEEKLFSMLDKFLRQDSSYRHMIILADSGMGKTSALLNYHVRNQQRGKKKRCRIAMLPLGIPNADEYIQKIPDHKQTILFLDAFDEDTKAIDDHKERLFKLMEMCRDFDRVILTCRTQFFPDDEEIPKETGIVRIGPRSAGEKAVYTFQKLYLMPLSDAQVVSYLRKRYPLWRFRQRQKAKETVEKIPLLSVRPMLLAFIPDLLKTGATIQYSFELYEALIKAWLERESYWVDPDNLRRFSERLAVDLHVNRVNRGAERVPRNELIQLAQEWEIALDDWQVTGRSLLNRDAEGNYKFAHRSIMEYLFIRCDVSKNKSNSLEVELTDQMIEFVKEIVSSREFQLLKNIPSIDLRDANLSQADLRGANLRDANLRDADLSRADLRGANLRDANLTRVDLSQADLSRANLRGANLTRARYNGNTKWPNNFDYQKSGAIGPLADLSRADLRGANLRDADLRDADLSQADLSQTDLTNTKYNGNTKWPKGFNPKAAGATEVR